jgi:hypothetical protein
MRNFAVVLGLAALLVGCSRKDSLEIPATGTDVTVQKRDGVNVAGRLVEVKAEQVVLESRDGVKTQVPRSEIASVRATAADDQRPKAQEGAEAVPTTGTPAPPPAASVAPAAPAAPVDPENQKPRDRAPEYREVTLPAGTVLPLELKSSVASDTSKVEDQVRATVRSRVSVNGVEALPAGTAVLGHVTSVQRAAKVKGRASIAFRFNQIDLPGDGGREPISTATVTRVAPPTKKKDATKIGVGAGAGAIVGGILGGGGGAAKGAAIGGGAGTAVVLSTRGDEVRLGPGAPVTVKLTAPLTLRVKS